MENAKYHSRLIEHEERLNDCFYVEARYWNSEYNSNKVSVIGENYLKKYWKNSMPLILLNPIEIACASLECLYK